MMRCSPRLLSLFILIFVAASCAPAIAPHGTENDKPTILPDAFLTRDGLRLPLRRWEAVKPRAIIVALHGIWIWCSSMQPTPGATAAFFPAGYYANRFRVSGGPAWFC